MQIFPVTLEVWLANQEQCTFSPYADAATNQFDFIRSAVANTLPRRKLMVFGSHRHEHLRLPIYWVATNQAVVRLRGAFTHWWLEIFARRSAAQALAATLHAFAAGKSRVVLTASGRHTLQLSIDDEALLPQVLDILNT